MADLTPELVREASEDEYKDRRGGDWISMKSHPKSSLYETLLLWAVCNGSLGCLEEEADDWDGELRAVVLAADTAWAGFGSEALEEGV